jgi:hypothetical protein
MSSYMSSSNAGSPEIAFSESHSQWRKLDVYHRKFGGAADLEKI